MNSRNRKSQNRKKKSGSVRNKNDIVSESARSYNAMRNSMSLTYRPSGPYVSPLPQVFHTRFVASGFCYTTSGAGSGDYAWSITLNGIFRPFIQMATGLTWNNLTPGTFLPPGSSALVNTNVYQLNIVEGVLVELDVTPQTVADSVVCTVTPTSTTSSPATVAAALTRPWTKQMTFASGRQYHFGDFAFRDYYRPSQFIGLPPVIYNNDPSGNFVGGVGSNPPAIYYLNINVETGDNAVLTNALEIRIRLTYDVKLYGLSTETLV
jgi:hypothetical protein